MSSIKTYEDLEAEEKRLQGLLYSHKENIKDSLAAVKANLNPFKQVAATAKRLFSRDRSNPMMKLGLDIGVDVVLRKFLLAKAGWFTKIVVPFFVKNYSSYFINEYKKSKLLQKIRGFFKEARKDVKETTEDVKQSVSNMT